VQKDEKGQCMSFYYTEMAQVLAPFFFVKKKRNRRFLKNGGVKHKKNNIFDCSSFIGTCLLALAPFITPLPSLFFFEKKRGRGE